MIHENDLKFKFQCPQIKLTWNPATPTLLGVAQVCCQSTEAELSGVHRDGRVHMVRNTIQLFTDKSLLTPGLEVQEMLLTGVFSWRSTIHGNLMKAARGPAQPRRAAENGDLVEPKTSQTHVTMKSFTHTRSTNILHNTLMQFSPPT